MFIFNAVLHASSSRSSRTNSVSSVFA